MAEMMIDDWATETTLEKIRQILEGNIKKGPLDALLRVMEDMAKGRDVDAVRARSVMESAKATADATTASADAEGKKTGVEDSRWRKLIDNGKKVHNEIAKQDIGKHLMDAGGMLAMPISSMEDAFAKITGVFTAVGASVFNASKALISSFGKIGAGLGKAMGAIGMFGGALLSVATGAIGYLLGAITAMGDTFFDLYDTGINFASGLTEGATGLGAMLEVATDARLSLGDFAEYLAKNTSVALSIGTKNMAQLSVGVRDAIYDMGAFGMSISETNEYLGDYLETSRLTGTLESMNQAQRTQAGAEYLEQITRLSMATGKRRKQVAEELAQVKKSTGARAFLMALDDKERLQAEQAIDTMTSLMNTFDDTGGMSKDFADSLLLGNFAATETGIAMAESGRQVEANMIQDIQNRLKNGQLNKKQAEEEMKRVAAYAAANVDAIQKTKDMVIARGDEAKQHVAFTAGAKLLNKSLQNMGTGLDKTTKTVGNWDEIQNAISQTWQNFMDELFGGKEGNNFSEILNEVSSTISTMFAPDSDLIKSLHSFARIMATHVLDALKWFQTGGAKDTMAKIQNFLSELPSKISAFASGIGAMIEAIKGFMFNKIGETDVLDDDGEKIGTKAVYGKMKSLGDMIFGAIGKGLEGVNWFKVAGVIAAAFAGIFLLKSVASMFSSALSTGMGSLLGKVAPGLSKVIPGAAAAGGGGGGGKAGKGMDTIAKAVGKLGKGVGQAIKGLMVGVAGGLSAFKPNVLIGAVIFGLSIAAVGAGIAAAAWIMGKALPTLAEGLGSFADLDGGNLIDVGLGMLSVAAGLAAMGVGSVVSGIGGLVGGAFSKLGDMVGAKSPLVMLEEFGKANINTKKVIANAEAMVAFSKAMALGGGGTAVAGIGTLVGGITGALGKFFGAEDPLTQLKKFGAVDIDGAKVKVNAEAMKLFASAMADAPAMKADVVGALFAGVVSIFGGTVTMPWANLKLFADADVDGAKVKVNAEAMKLFASAMEAAPVIKPDIVGALFAGVVSIFGGTVTMPWANLKLFADADVDGAKVKVNAEAMKAFGTAMSNAPEVKTERVGGIFGAIADVFGGAVTMPWANLKLFADADIDGAKVKVNAEAMKAFGTAMSTVPEVKTERIGGIFGAIADVFGGTVTMPWANLKLFADADIDGAKVKVNAEAMKAFGTAMSNVPEVKTERIGGIFGAIADVFGGATVMPWAKVKLFADADMGDATKLALNAKALGDFGTAISNMPVMPEGTREGGAWGFVKGIFAGDTKMPWDKVKAFAEADMGDTTKIVANANALSIFSKTMSGIDLASLEAWGDSDSMDKMSSAFGNLFGKKSPLYQIANLDKISTPLATAGTSLDSFNPKMKTLYDMLRDPAFVAGAGAVKVLTSNLGDLDDAVNDWSKDELEQFRSITQSLGNFQGAQMKGGQEAQTGKLEDINTLLKAIDAHIVAQTTALLGEGKRTTAATKESSMHVS
jgi:hypothetical protein